MREAVDYIRLTLRNPTAADKLVNDAFDAIYERLNAPESFEPYPSKLDREHPCKDDDRDMKISFGLQ